MVVINQTVKVITMNNPLSCVFPEITVHNNRAVTTSIAVANYFQKRHDHIIDKIRAVIANCDPAYHLPNFREMVREVPGGDGAVRQMPMFELTRDAFALIVMGFTGKKALQWKIRYIEAFNAMETELHNRPTSGRRGSYSIVIDFENDLPICSRLLNPGEIVMSYESFMEHALRMGNVVLPCDEVGKFTMDELQEMTAQAKRMRDHWQKQYSELERKYSS
jgi:Rha family phage regulatory protein